jgi:hypothetical protein
VRQGQFCREALTFCLAQRQDSILEALTAEQWGIQQLKRARDTSVDVKAKSEN